MSKVFLSYAGADRRVAAEVAQGLRAAGVEVWWDQDGIAWGKGWIDVLQTEITDCRGFLILIGERGIGGWVKAELGLALRRHFEQGLPLYALLLPGVREAALPPFLSLVQAKRLPQPLDEAEFRDLARTLAGDGDRDGPSDATDPDLCPYPGLESFGEDMARFFFGRQAETIEVLGRLGHGVNGRHYRWAQVEGPSGVGKSSLVRAGVVPAIKSGWLDDSEDRVRWRVIVMRPGKDPCGNLAAELDRAFLDGAAPPRWAELIQGIRAPSSEDRGELKHFLKVAVREGDRLLLVLDQFEEAMTLTGEETLRQRLDWLLAAALDDPDCPLYLITVIRSDFLLRFGELPRLQSMLNTRVDRYYLAPMGEAGLRDAVLTPARRAGFRFSDPTLPDRIVDEGLEAGDAALPLVANLLRLLWQRAHEAERKVLSAEDHKALGGVGGALAKGMDAVLKGLGDKERERARDLLLELVQPGRDSPDTRRTISYEAAIAAAGGGDEAVAVLACLSGQRTEGLKDPVRMVVVSGGAPVPTASAGGAGPEAGNERALVTVDLAHEILLRRDRHERPYCATLWGWLREHRQRLEDRALREVLAKRWQQEGGSRLKGLASRHQLRHFERAGVGSTVEQAFLKASLRRLRGLRGLSAIGVLVAGSVVWAAAGFPFERQPVAVSNWVDVSLAWVRAQVGYYPLPDMASVPEGKLSMGGEGENAEEQPRHEVSVSAFNLGHHELTFAEYDVFVFAARSDPKVPDDCKTLPDDQSWGRGVRPVIDVSWDCAKAYAAWLTRRFPEEKTYRLPTRPSGNTPRERGRRPSTGGSAI